ncbi:Bodo-specific multi-copy gene family, putative, partial [Bodo saltans]
MKSFIFQHRLEAIKCGRVIVRCCGIAARDVSEGNWFAKVMQDSATPDKSKPQLTGIEPAQEFIKAQSATDSDQRIQPTRIIETDNALCELIRTHVESITGIPQHKRDYERPELAYKTWIRETAWWFGIPEEIQNDEHMSLDGAQSANSAIPDGTSNLAIPNADGLNTVTKVSF